MDSFGATLKKEREERGLTLDTVAAVIGIDRGALAALERDEFNGLPDHEVMLRGLRSYAECLQVDAELMIEHYEQERERCLQRLAALVAERAVEAAPQVATPAPSQRTVPSSLPMVASALLILLLGFGAWWIFGSSRSGARSESAPASSETATEATGDAAAIPPSPDRAASTETDPAPIRIRAAASPGRLVIPEYGVGSGVRNRELVGRSDRFLAGTQAWFWTRVEGGKSGDRIDHVWLHEGVEANRVSLNIGGARWRTQSSKTLRSTGRWAVEARDPSGRVLARAEFDCTR